MSYSLPASCFFAAEERSKSCWNSSSTCQNCGPWRLSRSVSTLSAILSPRTPWFHSDQRPKSIDSRELEDCHRETPTITAISQLDLYHYQVTSTSVNDFNANIVPQDIDPTSNPSGQSYILYKGVFERSFSLPASSLSKIQTRFLKGATLGLEGLGLSYTFQRSLELRPR